jgi:hypothetical protein
MRASHLLAPFLALLFAGYACAQVGVETGITTGGYSGTTINPMRRLGSTVSRSVFRSTAAMGPLSVIAGPTTLSPAPASSLSLSTGAASASRSFVPRVAGQYVAGIAWRDVGVVPVVVKAGGQEATGTTAAPVLVHFAAAAAGLSHVTVLATGPVPAGGLTGDLEFVRAAKTGEPSSKSLLTPDQRLAEFTRKGPRPSVLPLLANLADRHLKHAEPATDLDGVFARALAATPNVAAADLEALVRDYDALPDAAKAQRYTARTLALRALTPPTLAAVSAALAQPGFGAAPPVMPRVTALEPALPAGGAYAPGATIRLVGENFASQPERHQVYLYPEVAGRYTPRSLPVNAATPTALLFQLPTDLPDGGYALVAIVDGKSTSAAVPFRVKQGGVSAPLGDAAVQAPARYRLSCLRLECVDETNPEWWGNDEVVWLLTAVGDGQAVTRAGGARGGLSDGVTQPLPEADRTIFGDVTIAQGMGVAVELWRWNPPAPPSGLGPWALRESFANALAAPEPKFYDPKPQDDVSGELAVSADQIGTMQAVWTAADLRQLLQPGQKLEQTLDLRLADAPLQYDATGYYRLTLELERLD